MMLNKTKLDGEYCYPEYRYAEYRNGKQSTVNKSLDGSMYPG
jgi:hypothetical protein